MDQLLIVDDEIEICEFLENAIGDMFSTVKMATTLADALELIKTENFSIIVFDLNLQGLNGGEIYLASRSEGNSNNDTPCLAISGHFSEDFINKHQDNIELLRKPFSIDELTEKIFKMMSTKPTKNIGSSEEDDQGDIDSLFDNIDNDEADEVDNNQNPPSAKTTDFLKNLTKK
ncbi:response regulator [Bacteriovoracaceae bacterium]|nr:response regulator [Bacteriovoracaceae bacterium]